MRRDPLVTYGSGKPFGSVVLVPVVGGGFQSEEVLGLDVLTHVDPAPGRHMGKVLQSAFREMMSLSSVGLG